MKHRKTHNHPAPTNLARYLRIHKGLSMQKLGKACGLHPNQICDFEHGKRGLALGSALRLAAYLGVSLDDLAYDRYANILPTLPPVPRRDPGVSRRLKQHQELCDRLGRAGEAYVARLEREKLAGTPYANGVNEAFADDPSAGFDIQSFTRDGHPICIEVKTTNGGADEPFYISMGERSLMEQCLLNGARYELHRVYHIFNKKKAGRVIYSAEELDKLFDFVPNDFRALRKKVAS